MKRKVFILAFDSLIWLSSSGHKNKFKRLLSNALKQIADQAIKSSNERPFLFYSSQDPYNFTFLIMHWESLRSYMTHLMLKQCTIPSTILHWLSCCSYGLFPLRIWGLGGGGFARCCFFLNNQRQETQVTSVLFKSNWNRTLKHLSLRDKSRRYNHLNACYLLLSLTTTTTGITGKHSKVLLCIPSFSNAWN